MRGDNILAHGFRGLARATASEGDPRQLEVNVVFTDPAATLAALRTARELARDLGAKIRVLFTQVVPYPAPLDSPPVSVTFTTRRLESLVDGTADRAEVYLCRDARQALQDVLKPRSLLVIGGKRRWWPSREERLGRWLQTSGHQVIFDFQTREERPGESPKGAETPNAELKPLRRGTQGFWGVVRTPGRGTFEP